MKRFVVVLFLIILTSGLAWGKGPADVSKGLHNLSSSNITSFYQTDEDSLCVFCHTPHGGSLDGALWNRNNPNPSSGWKHYNSATMSSTLKGLSKSRPPGAESMLCLSCHDGSISVNHVINTPNDRTTPIATSGFGQTDTKIVDFFGNPGSRIGGETGDNSGGEGYLTDDHPISFSYVSVINSSEYQPTGAKFGQLKTLPEATTNGVRFFGATNRVECSSCHDPHVNYADYPEYTPFLIVSNAGSNLCLACHTK